MAAELEMAGPMPRERTEVRNSTPEVSDREPGRPPDSGVDPPHVRPADGRPACRHLRIGDVALKVELGYDV
jgi:hypothetical protein